MTYFIVNLLPHRLEFGIEFYWMPFCMIIDLLMKPWLRVPAAGQGRAVRRLLASALIQYLVFSIPFLRIFQFDWIPHVLFSSFHKATRLIWPT